MGSKEATLRKGLSNWDAVKDAAMAGGMQSSLDLPGGRVFNDQDQSGILDFLAHSMRLQPRAAEQGIIEKLNGQIDTLMTRSYGDVDQAVEKFFEGIGSLNQVDPAQLERTILAVQKVIYQATDTVASLYQDAYFADRVQQDEYWSSYKGYASPDDKKATIQDRQAHAYAVSRDSRYFYYYSFLLWRRVSEKLGSLRDLQKTLEWFRSRSIKDKPW